MSGPVDTPGDGDAPAGPDETVLATLSASPGRRGMGTGMLVVLGGILLWTALAHPPQSIGWLLFLLGAAGLSFYSAHTMWRATSHTIVLTDRALYEKNGRMIAPIDTIENVDRGLFAFKPTNGFLLKLSAKAPRAWSLGMWWRLGRRVGVGGVTPGGQGRAMADILSALLADRHR